MQQVGRSDEACLELRSAFSYHQRKLIRRGLAVFSQMKMGGKDTFRLCRVSRIGPAESGYNVLKERFIRCHVFSQNESGLNHQGSRMRVKCGGNKVFSGGTLITAGGGIESQPVPVMDTAGPQIFRRGMRRDIIYPFSHRLKLAGENLCISICQIYCPRTDHGCVAPGGAGRLCL